MYFVQSLNMSFQSLRRLQTAVNICSFCYGNTKINCCNCIASCVCVQGACDSPSVRHQNGMEDTGEPRQVSTPSSKRLYNWNTTHFYPDIHKLDNDELTVPRQQRRHSEPRCFLRCTDNVSIDQQSSESSSSLASFDEVKVKQDSTMPVSQLTIQLSAPHTASGPIAKVDVDLDSGSESEDDAPKTWHRSRLHMRRGRRLGVGEHSGKKTDTSVPAGNLWKRAADRPSMRMKEQAEKRRKYVQQRCQVYGWDLTSDQEQQSVVDGRTDEGQQSATIQSQEDICFIDHSADSSLVNQETIKNSSANATSVAVKDRIRQFEATETLRDSVRSGRLEHGGSFDVSSPKSSTKNTSVKESSSFENIYDMVSLEPEKSSDEVVQFYEPQQARVDAVYCHSKPLMSNNLPTVRPESYKPNDRTKNLPFLASVANTSAACNISSSRPSSAPSKSVQKAGLDAKSIVEEEKLNFVEYKIDFRRQQSSANESGSGRSDPEKDTRGQPEPASTPHIPPDDYEYILRKIHYNRPQNKADQKPASQPYKTNQGSELHIEIKKPHTTTRHITVDVAKPSVPNRVESLQHSGLHHQFPARPDVIPSPNYPSSPNIIAGDFTDGVCSGKGLNLYPNKPSRTVLRTDCPSVSGLSALPTAGENTVYQWDSRIRTPERERFSGNKPQYVGATSTNSQNAEHGCKPPKPPREEFPRSRSPDFWNYNTTYEPGSPSSQSQLPQSMSSKQQEMCHTSKAELKDTEKLFDQDFIHDLVRGLDDNSELTPEATAVFREQYRWSIHEPYRCVEPDQLKHSQTSQLPCSKVFASSVCVPSKPVPLVGQISQLSLKDSRAVQSHKETVFSVTGYHRPQQQKTDGLRQNLHLKDDQMYPSYSDIRVSYNNNSGIKPEPLCWYSEADKRKPIINSPEVETALNRDCREAYFYCSGQQVDDQNITWKNSRRQCSEVDPGVTGWHGLCHRDNCAQRDVHRDVRLQGQKSQDRLVQQMSLGSEEMTTPLHSNSNFCATGFPLPGPCDIHLRASSDHSQTDKSSAGKMQKQPPPEVGLHKGRQPLNTSDHVLSRASTDYEKHILRGQESYRSQVMAQIEPSSVATGQDRSLIAKSSQNISSTSAHRDVSKGSTAGRIAASEIIVNQRDDGTPSDRSMHKVLDKKFSDASLTNQVKHEIYENEDPCVVNVAEIKAKLFGSSEDGTRKLFWPQNDAAKGPWTDRTGFGKHDVHVRYSNGARKKRAFTSDELTNFETLVEKLNKDEDENRSQWRNISPPVTGIQCRSATDDDSVKRLSLTNIKMLEGNRGKQSPRLEYAKEWLISGRHASASVNSGSSSEHKLKPCTASENTVQSAAHSVRPVENGDSFVSHKTMKSLPHTKSDDVCRPVMMRNVRSGSINEVNASSVGIRTSTPPEGSVVFHSHPAGQFSSVHSSSNSFVRRSLPALTEKDAERWRNMVLRIQENESRKEMKSRSVERLSQSAEMPSSSAVNMPKPVRMQAAASHSTEGKLAVSAQPLLHSSPDFMRATDPASLKPKRQQTPRDVKSRDDYHMKGIRGLHTNTDSGYLDSGSDSHGSSGADVPKRPLSRSTESDEVELQRYTCDEDDDIKLSAASLSLTTVDSAHTSADKSDRLEVSTAEYEVNTESPVSRTKHLQKLREDWFSKNIQQSHSSLLLDTPDSLSILKLDTPNKDVGFELSDSSKLGTSVPVSLGLPKEKSAKPLYVSPLVQTSSCGIYRAPSSVVPRTGDDRSHATADSAQLNSSSKISSFKMSFPSQEHGQNTGNREASTSTPQLSKVTHIPVRAVGFRSGQSPSHNSAFSPYVEHRDLQISRMGIGGANISETKKELIHVEPEQYKASRILERTVDQPSLMTYQRQSEQLRHQRQEVKEPHVKVTRQVIDSKIERTYRIESNLQPKVAQLSVRNELDKYEASDGEMTDATDVTLDVMVGTNQSLAPSVDAVDFSDVEFLSSANFPPKCDASFMKGDAKLHVSRPFGKSIAAAGGGSGDAAVAAAKTEMELFRKMRKDIKTDEAEAPVERRRSIKELVHSFEDMTSPFMRARPRSMEIRISSSSEEENRDDSVTGRKRQNVMLKASSSFKEATRLDIKSRQQNIVNH